MNLQNCNEGQRFGENANPFYAGVGLKGHSGTDWRCGYGTEIEALVAGHFYTMFPVERPAADGYTAIFTLCETPLETFEFSYGHVSSIDIPLGSTVKVGDSIGKEGNHGIVYSGGQLVSPTAKLKPPYPGSHRHYQKRIVNKVTKVDPYKKYLIYCKYYPQSVETSIYRDEAGYYYEYALNNGYASCVDWEVPLFNRSLFIGCTGYDVTLLQRALVKEGFATFTPTGTFGPLTMKAVMAYQRAHGLSPVGIAGPSTRAILNNVYKQLQ